VTPQIVLVSATPGGFERTRSGRVVEQIVRPTGLVDPEVIVLDIMMPKISGFEVCKRIRADPQTRDTAVLMVTALDQPSDIDRAVEAGTNDFQLCVSIREVHRHLLEDLDRFEDEQKK